jgi:hypothetical protein
VDSNHGGVIESHHRSSCHQRKRPGNIVPFIENLDTPAPGELLLVVDLVQIQHVTLHDSIAG